MTPELEAQVAAIQARHKSAARWYKNKGADYVKAHEDRAALLALLPAVWDEGRERAWEIAAKWADSKSCEQHDDNPCCHVRTGVSICNAIRALPSPFSEPQ